MKINYNNIKEVPELECGQLWMDETTDKIYMIAGTGQYVLVNLVTGQFYVGPNNYIENIFGHDRGDFVMIEAELNILRKF